MAHRKKADLEDHHKVIEEIMRCLVTHSFFFKLEKCEFDQEKIEYLRVVISHNKIEMNPKKVKAIKEWPNPKCVKDIQMFVGLCSYYQKFIGNFSNIAKPLYCLTEKNTPWIWTEIEQRAWDDLKDEFIKIPDLATYMDDQPIRLEVGASRYTTGTILLQHQEDRLWRPLGFISKFFNLGKCNHNIYNKEMLAII